MRTKYWGSIPGSTLSDSDQRLLPLLSGLVLFKENLQTDTALFIGRIKMINPEIELAVDHEGGWVNRFGATMQTRSAQFYADANDEAQYKEDLRHDFTILKNLGIDRVFGPCIDIDLAKQGRPSKVIGGLGRSYGDSYAEIKRWASIYIEVAHGCGLKTCLKHFPDHGYSQEDSHLELPIDLRTQAELAPVLAVYQQLIEQYQIDMVMLAHFALPNVTGHDGPITFDQGIKQMLPSVDTITDCLGMKAISGSAYERLVKAKQAGHQHVMLTHQPSDQLIEALLGLNKDQVTQDNLAVTCSF
ncbi:MAG: hypothetical protein FJ186_01180 [Gammaproteobacteria bacterium]|jgi:beta-N-acetylhexosaminidase|nr:hypothetical protein [Gammaproteobacteria bacterium]